MSFDSPYADYVDAEQQIKPRLKFEERLVKHLLQHYDLADTRTRFCLLDLAKQQGHHGEGKSLTLAAWNRFFPAYPVQLYGWPMGLRQRERASYQAVWCDFWSTPFARPHPDLLLGDARCPGAVHDWKKQLEELLWEKPSVIVYEYGGIKLKQSPVVLFDVPVNESLAAPIHFYRNAHGVQVVMQPLWVVLATIDQNLDPHQDWMDSALRPEHTELVEQPR